MFSVGQRVEYFDGQYPCRKYLGLRATVLEVWEKVLKVKFDNGVQIGFNIKNFRPLEPETPFNASLRSYIEAEKKELGLV